MLLHLGYFHVPVDTGFVVVMKPEIHRDAASILLVVSVLSYTLLCYHVLLLVMFFVLISLHFRFRAVFYVIILYLLTEICILFVVDN